MSNVTDQPTDNDDVPTTELPIAPGRRKGFIPHAAGVALCALWIMAIGMIVAQVVGATQDRPGPGALAVGMHVAGAAVAVFCYRTANRAVGPARSLSFFAMLAIMVALAWFFWWSPR